MRILFIGDFRHSANYGSIATTDCLLKMVNSVLSSTDEIKIIDRRSYDKQTPINGFKKVKVSFGRKIVRFLIPQKIRMALLGRYKSIPASYEDLRLLEHVPVRYSEYNIYVNKMLNGGMNILF